jgi:hypothetical protein
LSEAVIHTYKSNGECVIQVRYNYFLSSWSFGYSSAGKVI